MKIIDLLHEAAQQDKTVYSFEYFPPKTEAGVENLYARIERMARLHPTFIDITWGAGGSTAERTLEIATTTQNLSGLQTMMHLTCTNMSREHLSNVLKQAKADGIQNILALRGDPPDGSEEWEAHGDGFNYAVDLVRFIREEHGDHFGICVAGYPDGHEEAVSYQQDIQYLKEKVDAGADFVITQLFYDCDSFFRFVQDCRDAGIDCPIVPGIMPIHNYNSFKKVTRFCKNVPAHIETDLEPIKSDDEAVKRYGVQMIVDMCRRLQQAGHKVLHFYTLNLERVVSEILGELDLIHGNEARTLPWRHSANSKRRQEDVRPVFWSNRPKSYHSRTMQWDEFPNGRWGDARSPAFGDLTDYHLSKMHLIPKRRRKIWGETLHHLEDVYDVFVRFCKGEIKAIPWYDQAVAPETNLIREHLIRMNLNGFMTINSQPRVHAASSDDPVVGWGGSGGYVYQKAYVEFFTSAAQLELLRQTAEQYSNVSFHAVNREGLSYSNCDTVNALTWGVFPGREIIQPTVVDPDSFMVWKDEAFSLWLSAWASIYPEQSKSRVLLEDIHDNFFLVNVVDNDFINGDIWAFFDDVLHTLKRHSHQQLFEAQTQVEAGAL